MIISPLNPIFFLGNYKTFGAESDCLQVFSTDDVILLQVIRTSEENSLPCYCYDANDMSMLFRFEAEKHKINTESFVDIYTMTYRTPGVYRLRIGDQYSEIFQITDDKVWLDNTVCFRYSLLNNSSRSDTVSIVAGKRIFFTFRTPGGFKDEGWTFSVDNEQFVTPESDILELYSRESTQKTLTVGSSRGVPIWYGQLLNRILTCRYVYIDDVRYARFESSVPEKSQVMEGLNSFVFTQKLQEVIYLKD